MWMILAFSGMLAPDQPSGPDARRVLTPLEAIKAGEQSVLTVQCHVASAEYPIPVRAGEGDEGWQKGHGPGDLALVALDRLNDQDDRFLVILDSKVVDRLRQLGIKDLGRHFAGHSVQVAGRVQGRWYTSPTSRGVDYELIIDDLSQIVQVE